MNDEVNLNRHVWRWFKRQVEFRFTPDACGVLHVKTRVRLEATWQVCSAEGGRAQAFDIDLQLFCHNFNEQCYSVSQLFVCRRWTHNFQPSPVIGKAWYTAVSIRCQQTFVHVPRDVVQHDALL